MTSIQAGPLFRSVTGILMIHGVYIHDMTPETAEQWIGVLQQIADDK